MEVTPKIFKGKRKRESDQNEVNHPSKKLQKAQRDRGKQPRQKELTVQSEEQDLEAEVATHSVADEDTAVKKQRGHRRKKAHNTKERGQVEVADASAGGGASEDAAEQDESYQPSVDVESIDNHGDHVIEQNPAVKHKKNARAEKKAARKAAVAAEKQEDEADKDIENPEANVVHDKPMEHSSKRAERRRRKRAELQERALGTEGAEPLTDRKEPETPSTKKTDKASKKQAKSPKRAAEAGTTESTPTKLKPDMAAKVTQAGKQLSRANQKPLAWTMSESIGGQFLSVDPIFTPDEKHIIFGTESAINVYSTSNSLLVHSFPSGTSGRICAFALSDSSHDTLYAATNKGHVLKWNIAEGRRVGRWSIAGKLFGIHAGAVKETGEDLIYIVDRTQSWEITAHRFGSGGDPSKTDMAVLVKFDKPIRSLKVIEGGRVLIAMTSDGVLVGTSTSALDGELKKLKYTWKEIKCSEAPNCFAVQVTSALQRAVETSKKSAKTQIPTINVVIGGVKGCLFVYQDILNQASQVPRNLHWHREAVGAVAWSLDGNYIISGGKETVLVLWQLETGRKQFLPNLESPIRSLVVSPSGSSYAVRLGDNSIMVLSTSELTPTTNIVGLQSWAFTAHSNAAPLPTTVESLVKHGKHADLRYAACVISPHNPNRIIVAVPAYQAESDLAVETMAAPYIQTFDVANSRHTTRQALSRTNATSTNLGPEGNRIVEPNIKHMQVTNSGRWLATVDEWFAPQQDISDLTVQPENTKAATKRMHDIQLKFWAWDAKQEEWMLNSRIATPHQKPASLACESIVDLAVDPSSTRFATLGADSTVRVWTPKSKTPSGKVVRGERKSGVPSSAGQVDTWWSLDYSVPLPASAGTDAFEPTDPRRGKIAFSNDGSTLAVHLHSEADTDADSRSTVHFLDADSGVIVESRTSMCAKGDEIHDFGFLERYFICAGRDKALLWDVTTFHLHAELSLTPQPSSSSRASSESPEKKTKTPKHNTSTRPLTHLAINLPTSTFALAVPLPLSSSSSSSKKSTKNPLQNYTTKLSIFSPASLATSTKPLFETTLPRATLALLSASGTQAPADEAAGSALLLSSTAAIADQKGFLLLDAGAEVRVLRPKTSSPSQVQSQIQNTQLTTIPDSTSTTTHTNAGILSSLLPITAGAAEGQIGGTAASQAGTEADEEGAKTTLDLSQLLLPPKQEDDRPVVRTQELAQVFDYPSHAMPGMMELWKGVVGLFAGGPGNGSASAPPASANLGAA